MPKKIYKLHTEDHKLTDLKIDYKAELNDEQFRVVTSGNGPCLVLAGAGSGKTRTLVYRLAYLLETGVKPENILLMTFTNKAAKEMVSRTENLLGHYPRGLWAGTFHHIGNRVLRKYAKKLGLESTYTILDQADAQDLINNIIGEVMPRKDKYFPKARVIKNIISFATNAGVSIATAITKRFDYIDEELVPTIEVIAEKYTKRKLQTLTLDYDDLLLLWLKLLDEYPDTQKKLSAQFKYILVDEYQDTNHIQASIIKHLTNYHGNILVVGDDAQSIYSFRAADVTNILSFPDLFKDTNVFRLETNYRSTPEILALANESISHNTEQFKKTLHASRKSGQKPVIASLANTEQQASFITQRILELHDEGTSLNDIAVLFRADYHALELELALNKKNIPYIKRGGLKFFEQAHLKDVVAYLKILHNPQDEIAWTRVLLMQPGIGKATAARVTAQLTGKTLEAMISQVTISSAKARASWTKVQALFATLIAKKSPRIGDAIEMIVRQLYEEYALATFENARDRLEDIDQLASFSDQYDTIEQLLSDITLAENFQAERVAAEPDDYGEELVLSTIHQAKGLEWDHVFVLHLASGQFPHTKSMNNRAEFEEERRLFYVASTRAKDELYLLYPITLYSHASGLTFTNPSEFIREIDTKLFDEWSIQNDDSSNDLPTIEYLPEV
ncbi:MAG: ATP-dependent helicase [Patescibacteria group bacterium]